jgi:methylmalonyl-CoA mutase N-terminal domain/subunit
MKRWRKSTLAKALSRVALRAKKFETSSGIVIEDLYTPTSKDLSTSQYEKRLGLPGEYPYTRGVQPSMYRAQLWTMRQYAGFGSAKETNTRYKYLLDQGTTGLSVAFDLPTQMGRDSDHSLAKGEVGRVGVAIDTVEDMEILFSGIPLEKISTSMTINATAHVLLAFYLVMAKRREVSWDKLRGTVQNDILKEYIARGTFIYPPRQSLKIVTDIIEFCEGNVPNWNTISVSGYHIREAGATAAQELGFTLANAITYVENVVQRGLKVDSFAPRIAFFFNSHNNIFEEIAKFRAARRMWAKIMKNRFKAKDPRSLMLRFHTQTAGSTLTAQQPYLNIVRTSYQGLAATLGGTQSLHTNSFDEALGLPTEDAALIALRTQQILAYESGVADVVDPLGGSYFIESLTDEIEKLADQYLEKIGSIGGMVNAIEQGFPQGEIESAAFTYQKDLESGKNIIVGVNQFIGEPNGAIDKAKQISILKVSPAAEHEQIDRLHQIKTKRDAQAVSSALQELRETAEAKKNIMEAVCRAAQVSATLGEISDVLRALWGDYRAN